MGKESVLTHHPITNNEVLLYILIICYKHENIR